MTTQLARYVRVSKKGERDWDKTLTQDIQLQAMERHAAGRDLTLSDRVYDDLDRPAPDFDPVKRPKYAEAKAWVMESPTTRGLIVYNASRFGRNDWSMVEVNEFHKAGALLVIADSGQTSDLLDSPDGYFQMLIAFGIASTDRRRIAEGWKKAIAERTRRGLHHGRVPVGYLRGEDGVLQLDPATADGARAIFEGYASGVSVRQLSMRLAELKGTDTAEPSTVKHMMQNEVFIGRVRRKDDFVEGAHEPLVSDEVWAGVQRRNRQTTRQSSQLDEPRSFLSGVMRCDACGGSVVTVAQKGRGTFVSCRQNRVKPAGSADRCPGFGAPTLAKVEADFLHLFGLWCSADHDHLHNDDDRRGDLERRATALAQEQQKAVQGRSRLAVAYAKGLLSEEALESGVAALEAEIAQRAQAMAVVRDDLLLLPQDEGGNLEKARTFLEAVDELTVAEARHLVRQFMREWRIKKIPDPMRGGRQIRAYHPWWAEHDQPVGVPYVVL